MKTKLIALALAAAVGASPTSFVRAEEGGSGHYLPGSMASFMDAVPPAETIIARLNFVFYEGSFSGNPIPFARFAATNVKAESYAGGLTLLWRPPLDLGEKWSFALSTTIPYVWLDVSADASAKVTLRKGTRFERTLAPTVKRSDSVDGLGDIVLMPLMLNYKFTPDFSANFRVGIYAPTGDYEVGRLANPGKNYWTVEPTLALMYFGQKNGFEASLFAGYDFNTENGDTDYQTGQQIHLDGTIAQHFPLAGGLVGVGVNGYWYDQVTGDSGDGATFGDFKGRTAGFGPVISYAHKIGGVDMLAEVKWLHEVETKRRLEGDYIWAKVIFKF
jgi:hypothetical protein